MEKIDKKSLKLRNFLQFIFFKELQTRNISGELIMKHHTGSVNMGDWVAPFLQIVMH